MNSSIYICSSCGAQTPKWAGRCLECGAWGTLSEDVVDSKKKPAIKLSASDAVPFASIDHVKTPRIKTGIDEVDQVLGGGIVPGSFILLGGEPGIGKCLTGDTRLLDPSTGAFLAITAWKKQSRAVVSFNQETYRLCVENTTAFHDQGIKPIVEITTRLGRSLRCTHNHPLLTPDGWKMASELQSGDRVASPRALPFFGNQLMDDSEVKCIAYALSDGSTSGGFSVTAALPEIWNDLPSLAKYFNVKITAYPKKNNKAIHFKFTQPWKKKKEAKLALSKHLYALKIDAKLSWAEWARRAGIQYGQIHSLYRGRSVPDNNTFEQIFRALNIQPNEVLQSLRNVADRVSSISRFIASVGLRDKKAATKDVPECIFLLPKDQLSLFLKVIFSCDGSLYISSNDQVGISYSSINKKLAQDIQHLLLRFGFIAKLRTKVSRFKNIPYTAYELEIHGIAETKRFIKQIGIWGRDAEKKRIAELAEPSLPSTHRDTIPTGRLFWRALEHTTGGASYKEMSRQCGMTIHANREERPLTRSVMTALATAYPDPFLRKLSFNDVYWDEIVSIDPAGNEAVYDLTVTANENFVANDLIVHNSTILAEIALKLENVLYCSGEESGEQIKLRLDRITGNKAIPPSLLYVSETMCEKVCATIQQQKPILAIVDSIQTIASNDVESEAGSITQVRACTVKLLQTAKEHTVPIIITGHVTKEGGVAGPKTLEHLVDTVIYLEGDSNHYFRLLKTVKNRFGSTNEVGVFEMTATGLKEVKNPSSIFITDSGTDVPGTSTAVITEGTRAFLVNVQALASKTYFGYPQRRAVGCDTNRLQLLIAVLTKRLGLNLGDQDIHINIVGGLKISEPAIDLAVCASIISAYKGKAYDSKTVFIGEVGLSGEVRQVSDAEKRLKEAEKLGFKTAYIPKQSKKLTSSLTLVEIKNLRELAE